MSGCVSSVRWSAAWLKSSLPSPLARYDERTLPTFMDKDELQPILQNQYDTFITEDDFVQMKLFGLNSVRIPDSFWEFDMQPGESFLKLNQ